MTKKILIMPAVTERDDTGGVLLQVCLGAEKEVRAKKPKESTIGSHLERVVNLKPNTCYGGRQHRRQHLFIYFLIFNYYFNTQNLFFFYLDLDYGLKHWLNKD